MNRLIPTRRWAALLLILGLATTSIASAAFAGGYRHYRSTGPRVSASVSWRSGDPYAFGGFAVRERGWGAPVREEACAVNHPPHAWFNDQLWCSGKNADGSWRGPWHCEDQFGRKKVNLASFDPGCEKWIR